MPKFAWILAMLLTAVTAFFGLYNGPRELGSAVTPLQQSVSIGVIVYGILGAIATVALFRRRAWSVRVVAAWAVVIVYVATVASFAYHDPGFSQTGTLTGVIGAAIATVVCGALVVWAARVATRKQSGHIPTP